MSVKPLVEKDAQGALHLNFHVGQGAAWLSRHRIIMVLAGTQGGKTSFGPHWLAREIYGGEYEPGVPCPGRGSGDYIAVTGSYDLFKLKMLPAMLEVFEGLLGAGRLWTGDGVIELLDPQTGKFRASRSTDPMWGRVILRSASSPGGLESATAKAAWLDEAGQDTFNVGTWEAVLRRLSLAQGRILGTTTPYNLGYLKTEIYDRWAGGDPDYDVIQFPSIINPAFPRAEFERAERTMPKWKFDLFYRGQFAKPAGLIYGDFDPDTMVIDPFPIPETWPRLVGVDFGAVNNASLWLAVDLETGRVYAYREILEGGQTTREKCERIKRIVEEELGDEARDPLAGPLHRFYGGAPSEQQERWDWASHGVRVKRPLVADVEGGIDRVIELIKTDRFRVFRGMKQLIESLAVYSRECDENGDPTPKIKNKDGFHLLDCLRYGVGPVKPRSKVGVSWL